MTSFLARYPVDRGVLLGDADLTARRRRQVRDARAAVTAAQRARAATGALLGESHAHRSSWRGRADGTATGLIDGVRAQWVPEAGTPGRVTLVIRCTACAVWWLVPVPCWPLAGSVRPPCGCLDGKVAAR